LNIATHRIRKDIAEIALLFDVLTRLAEKSGPMNEDEQKLIDSQVSKLTVVSHGNPGKESEDSPNRI
jgi:hypothetical protein